MEINYNEVQDVLCLENEIFEDIPGFEGMYKISNFNRVKSFKKK